MSAQFVSEIKALDLNYFPAGSNARRILEESLEIIIPSIEAQLEACQERQAEMLRALALAEPCTPPPLIEIDLTDIRKLVRIRREGINH